MACGVVFFFWVKRLGLLALGPLELGPLASSDTQRILGHYAVKELLERDASIVVAVEASDQADYFFVRRVAFVLREDLLQAL